jgi:hypothetical protein
MNATPSLWQQIDLAVFGLACVVVGRIIGELFIYWRHEIRLYRQMTAMFRRFDQDHDT